MQAVLQRKEDIEDVMSWLQGADSSNKNEIENNIVNIGEEIVEHLVHELKNLKGIQRGIVAMSIIRIGECAITPLRKEGMRDKDFSWIANYLISEIKCSK